MMPCSALAVSGGRAVQDEQAFHLGITCQRIADGLLHIVRARLVPLHDLINERPPAWALRFRVVDDRGYLCEIVLRAMVPKLHRAQIQRTVLAVEQINIPVKGLHRQREHRFSVLDHGFSVFAELQLLDPLDESLAGILLGDGQGEQIQLVRQQLCQLCHLEVFHVRLPDSPVVDIPDAALTVVPCDRLEVIGEGMICIASCCNSIYHGVNGAL